MTPLQVVIAKKIIKERDENSYFGLYLTYNDNEKNRYYYNILDKECDNSFFLHIKDDSYSEKIRTVVKVKQKINKIKLINIETIFISNIDLLIVHYIVSKIDFKNIISFDDGIGNILTNSVYFIQKKESAFNIIIKKILGIKFKDIYALKKLISWHYTIYPNEKNIIQNVKNINIFPELQCNNDIKASRVKKIILGQPLEGYIGEDNYRKIISKIHKLLDIDYYFPHPRETLIFDDELVVINSNLIIEDYLVQELQNSNANFEIYTFFSSAVLALNSSERIDISVVSDTLLMKIFSEAYQFFIDRDVKLIDLDELS